jgi:cobalamin synthase
MPAQYALAYYLGSTILGSLLFAIILVLAINVPNGTLFLDGFGMAFLISCAFAMISSLPFHGWLNWVWYKRLPSQPYEDFFQSFLRKYWVGSTVYLLLVYILCIAYFILEARSNGGSPSGIVNYTAALPFLLIWLGYVPLGWWIIKRLKGVMQPSETDV